jgi:hypothetical protein
MKKNKFLLILIVSFILVIAIEMPAKVIHVTTTRDNVSGSLREAVSTANRNSEPDVIYLPAGTYLLTGTAGEDDNAGGDLDLNSRHKINIIGAGCNLTFVDGNHLDRVFHILKGKVTMSGVTIRGGKVNHLGGGIWNEGNLVLSHCTISGNTTSVQSRIECRLVIINSKS